MSNTLKLGNGKWATGKDTLLSFSDTNNNYKPLPFSFSRDTSATVVNKDGLIETVGSGEPRIDFKDNTKGALLLEPTRSNLLTYSSDFPRTYWTKIGASIQGDPSTADSELVTNGSFATDSDWIKLNGTTISGGVARVVADGNIEAGSSNWTLKQAVFEENKTYQVTFRARQVFGSGAFQVGRDYYFFVDKVITSSFVEYSFTVNSESLNFDGYLVFGGRTSGDVFEVDNISVKEVQGFSAPDGTNNAFKLVGDGANSTHLLRKYIGATASTTHSFSFFVKKGEITKLGIREDAQTGAYISFDLNTKTIITEVSMTLTYEEVGDYLKLKVVSQIGSNGTAGYAIYMLDDTYSGGVVNGSRVIPNGSGFHIYGAQLEQGSYATSYIPTSGQANGVTRVTDALPITELRSKNILGSVAFSYLFDFTHQGGGTFSGFFNEVDNNSNYKGGWVESGGLQYRTPIGGGNFYVNVKVPITSGDRVKCCVTLNGSTRKIYANGVLISTLNNCDSLSNDIDGFIQYYGNTNANYESWRYNGLQVYNTELTNAEAIALTS